MKAHLSQVVLLVIVTVIHQSSQITLDEELTLTADQKVKLDKFKEVVFPKISAENEWMKEDLQLVRWLRVNDFDIPAAEKMFLENIKWRKDNNIDNILNEDWSDFNDYRVLLEGCDNEERPVISTIVGDWDMRAAVVQGKAQRMMRYTDKLLEEGATLVRHLLKQGRNVTQFVEIFDLSNFNFVTHGCPQCLAIYAYNFQSYEKHYPLSVHKAITVNTPVYFSSVFQILRPLLSKHTRDTLSFYGRDKEEWRRALRKEIGEENLSQHFGGTKTDAVDVDDIRKDPTRYECHGYKPFDPKNDSRNNVKRELSSN